MDRKYELVCIIDPQVGDGGFDPIIEKYQGKLEEQGGEIVNLDKWGTRKLAFISVSMKRRQHGYYVCYQFTAPPGDFESIQSELKLDEDILRYLLITIPGEFVRVPVLPPDTVYVREREERFSRGRGGPPGRRPDRPDSRPRPPVGDSNEDEDEGGDSAETAVETVDAVTETVASSATSSGAEPVEEQAAGDS